MSLDMFLRMTIMESGQSLTMKVQEDQVELLFLPQQGSVRRAKMTLDSLPEKLDKENIQWDIDGDEVLGKMWLAIYKLLAMSDIQWK